MELDHRSALLLFTFLLIVEIHGFVDVMDAVDQSSYLASEVLPVEGIATVMKSWSARCRRFPTSRQCPDCGAGLIFAHENSSYAGH